ncbi:MAG TPA: TIGR03564 family F420-dependent LLM class oxidoreductase [Acidimicrobiia bacterium]|nr:TIGR03564 family F420-dependent LLM class oxidoreductase [Acidimicrobiia bacterium]
MQLGVFFPTKEYGTIDEMVSRFRSTAGMGFDSLWMPQSAGFDALTAIAVAAREVPEVAFGTSVIPTYPRHPVALAAQALTANAAAGGRLVLGLGLSHKMAIEGSYGISYDQPARHMREYLAALMPLLVDRAVNVEGETITARSQLAIPGADAPPVLLAALQPRMLALAGGVANGTVTWCTGPITLAEQIVPLVNAAAADAGRPAPRIVVPLPTIVTDDEAYGRAQADSQLEGYGRIPVYRAVLDREGVEGPGDVSIVGDEASVTAQLTRLAEIGATDFVAIPSGNDDDRTRTLEHLSSARSALR